MTTTTAPPAPSGVLPTLVLRLGLIAVCTTVAFWDSLTRSAVDALPGGLFGYLLLVPLMALVMAIGITRRSHDELPIHDREIDAIVGVLLMALSVGAFRLLVPRYRDSFYLLRTDLFALLLFVIGACVLLFGLRQAGRYWPVWAVLVLVPPLGYRLAVLAIGGTWVSVAVVSTALVATGVGVAVARTRRIGWTAFALTLVLGFAFLAVQLALVDPESLGPVSARAAPVTAGTIVALGALVSVVRRRDTNWELWPRRRSPVTRPWKAVLFAVATAGVLAASSLPSELTIDTATGPPPTAGQGLVPPTGWTETARQQVGWAERFFGEGATITRQTWTANEVNPAWDDKGRKRTVLVDSLLTHDPDALDVYPGEILYTTIKGRRSPTVRVDLGEGVRGYLYTIVDQDLFLTWTKLTFVWTRGDDLVQLVNLISVDNHDPDAQFPELDPSGAAVFSQTLNVLFRGNAVEEDQNPEYKDKDLMTTLGSEVVARQWEVAG